MIMHRYRPSFLFRSQHIKSTEIYYEEALPALEALLEEAAGMTRQAFLKEIEQKNSQRASSATKRLSWNVSMQTRRTPPTLSESACTALCCICMYSNETK